MKMILFLIRSNSTSKRNFFSLLSTRWISMRFSNFINITKQMEHWNIIQNFPRYVDFLCFLYFEIFIVNLQKSAVAVEYSHILADLQQINVGEKYVRALSGYFRETVYLFNSDPLSGCYLEQFLWRYFQRDFSGSRKQANFSMFPRERGLSSFQVISRLGKFAARITSYSEQTFSPYRTHRVWPSSPLINRRMCQKLRPSNIFESTCRCSMNFLLCYFTRATYFSKSTVPKLGSTPAWVKVSSLRPDLSTNVSIFSFQPAMLEDDTRCEIDLKFRIFSFHSSSTIICKRKTKHIFRSYICDVKIAKVRKN